MQAATSGRVTGPQSSFEQHSKQPPSQRLLLPVQVKSHFPAEQVGVLLGGASQGVGLPSFVHAPSTWHVRMVPPVPHWETPGVHEALGHVHVGAPPVTRQVWGAGQVVIVIQVGHPLWSTHCWIPPSLHRRSPTLQVPGHLQSTSAPKPMHIRGAGQGCGDDQAVQRSFITHS